MSDISNSDLMSVLFGIKQDIGEVKAGVKANQDHTDAVAHKLADVNRSLDEHKSNTQDAHGTGAERRGRAGLSGAITGVIGGIIAAISLLKLLGWKP